MEMEGGGGSFLQLDDIGDYKLVEDIYPIGIASLFTALLTYTTVRIGNLGDVPLNAYLDVFGLDAFLLTSSLVTLVLLITRYFYSIFYASSGRLWSPFVFICIAIAVNFIHDGLMYFAVIQTLPAGKNEMIDMFKQLTTKFPKLAITGIHSLIIGIAAFIAMIVKDMNELHRAVLLIATLYAIPYVLAIVGKKPPPPPLPPAKKKEEFRGFY
jgi:hypothetical protein